MLAIIALVFIALVLVAILAAFVVAPTPRLPPVEVCDGIDATSCTTQQGWEFWHLVAVRKGGQADESPILWKIWGIEFAYSVRADRQVCKGDTNVG